MARRTRRTARRSKKEYDVSFMGRKRTKSGKLAKRKSRIEFDKPKRRAGRTPKRLVKFAELVKAGKVRRNRKGQITSFIGAKRTRRARR
jgi:hypothetical protein